MAFHPSDLLQFHVSPGPCPERTSIRAILEAHVRAQELGRTRSLLVHILAVFSGGLWAMVWKPDLVSVGPRSFMLYSWCCLVVVTAFVGMRERGWRRLRDREITHR